MKTKDAHSAWREADAAVLAATAVWNEANAAEREAESAWLKTASQVFHVSVVDAREKAHRAWSEAKIAVVGARIAWTEANQVLNASVAALTAARAEERAGKE